MHEYGIAYDLYATARRAALENKADRVLKVNAAHQVVLGCVQGKRYQVHIYGLLRKGPVPLFFYSALTLASFPLCLHMKKS